jgi:hypothetical protein
MSFVKSWVVHMNNWSCILTRIVSGGKVLTLFFLNFVMKNEYLSAIKHLKEASASTIFYGFLWWHVSLIFRPLELLKFERTSERRNLF